MIENLLVTVANSTSIDLAKLPEELQLYGNDKKIESAATDATWSGANRNVKVHNCIPIKSITNVRIICDIINKINISKEMSEVLKLLKIFIQY